MTIKRQNTDWICLFILWFVVFSFFSPHTDCLWIISCGTIHFNVALHIQSSFDYLIWCYHISTNVLGWVGVADASDLCVSTCGSTDPKLIFQYKICYWWEGHLYNIELFIYPWGTFPLFLSLGPLYGLHCWVRLPWQRREFRSPSNRATVSTAASPGWAPKSKIQQRKQQRRKS